MGSPAILVVDTRPELFQRLSELLQPRYRVTGIRSANPPIQSIKKGRYDAIVIGQSPEGRHELELVRSIKAAFPKVPVILTGKALTREVVIDALRAGVNDVLVPPIQREEFLASLARISSEIGRPPLKDVIHRKWRRMQSLLNNSIRSVPLAEVMEVPGSEYLLLPERQEPHQTNSAREIETDIIRATQVSSPLIGPSSAEIITPATFTISPKILRASSTLNSFLLGPFQVVLNGILLDSWSSKKGKSLLAYMLYHHREKNLREVLMEKFWPERSIDSARNSLNVALCGIRKQLRDIDANQEHILFKDECYLINPDLEIQLDHEQFLNHWRLAKRLERESGIEGALEAYENAISLYKGDFFEDEPYEDWPSAERENIKEVYLFILDRLSNYYGSSRNYSTAITLCKKILAKDDCREDVHRRLMFYYYQTGHRDMAIKQFQKCSEVLQAELRINPSRLTLDLLDQIKQEGSRLEEKHL